MKSGIISTAPSVRAPAIDLRSSSSSLRIARTSSALLSLVRRFKRGLMALGLASVAPLGRAHTLIQGGIEPNES